MSYPEIYLLNLGFSLAATLKDIKISVGGLIDIARSNGNRGHVNSHAIKWAQCDIYIISKHHIHYDDVIMRAIASQSTSLTIVYSTVYSGADQRKHQSSASLAFVWGIHRDWWIPRTKGQLRGKCFHLMTSSCAEIISLKQLAIDMSEINFHWWLNAQCERHDYFDVICKQRF